MINSNQNNRHAFSKKLLVLLLILLPPFLVSACICSSIVKGITSNPKGEDVYVSYLKLDSFPPELSNFRMISSGGLFDNAHFEYNAPNSYFEEVAKYIQANPLEGDMYALAPIDCNNYQMPSDYTYWTDEAINLEGQTCYYGIRNFVAHYIIYNPITTETIHFTGYVRD